MTPTTRDHGRAALPVFRYARPPRPDAAFETVPRYRRGDGGLTGRPAAGGPFSVARLAAGFTPQALDRGLFPESPWADSARVRFAPPRPSGRSAPAEFAERFEGVLERVIGDREAWRWPWPVTWNRPRWWTGRPGCAAGRAARCSP
ncbi:hypothetical protein LUW76_21220 [Actinomadura madurae]|uniref:hypothetical protein n=1 Tax=Actinomadura madurae TaxID=1993 RepID=UPI0020264EA7|nr:hypothetical protein [Actinomadura madurae]URM96650.1 hypothetical protein LUW76_21220 [Actinomadura madurae]